MTYKLNPSLIKIESSIDLLFPDNSVKHYESGKELVNDIFDKRYTVKSIKVKDSNTIEISLEELSVPDISYTGEELVSFF